MSQQDLPIHALESSFSGTSGNRRGQNRGWFKERMSQGNWIQNRPIWISGALLPPVLGLVRKSFGFREEMLTA
jgi:hypothetical protein